MTMVCGEYPITLTLPAGSQHSFYQPVSVASWASAGMLCATGGMHLSQAIHFLDAHQI